MRKVPEQYPLTYQPLAVVQEKAKIERSASQRVSSSAQAHRQQASIDLFGDDPIAPPARPSTTDPTPRAPPKQAQPAQPRAQKPGDSLLGLDFFGSTQPSAASRPSSTASTPAPPSGMSRPDLKQSILSLYSKPQPAPAPVQHERTNSFGDMASPRTASTSSNTGSLTDAFSGLKFPSATSPPPAKPAEKPSPFSNLTNFGSTKSTPAAPKVTSPSGSASGDLFDSLTSPTIPAQKPQSRTTSISSNGQDFFGGFASPATKPAKPNPPSSSLSNDLFGLSSPPPAPAASMSPPKPAVPSPQQEMSSAFNLSSPSFQPQAPAPPKPADPVATTAAANMMSASIDPWGGNAWSTPDPVPEPAPAPSSTASMMKVPDTLTPNDIGSGWGAPKPTPTVAADEDFGGWTSAAPVSAGTATTTTNSTKPAGGFGGADDLFSNVWE